MGNPLKECSGGDLASRGVELTGHTQPVYACCVSQDGCWLLSASGDKCLKLWDLKRLIFVRDMLGHMSAVYSCALSPDGKWAISGSLDGEIKVWQTSTGLEVYSVQEHKEAVMALTFSALSPLPAASRTSSAERETPEPHPPLGGSAAYGSAVYSAASGSADKTIALWRIMIAHDWPLGGAEHSSHAGINEGGKGVLGDSDAEAALSQTPSADVDGAVQGLAGAGDRQRPGGEVSVLQDASLVGHRLAVCSLVFGDNASVVVSGSADGTIKVWSTKV